MNYREYQRLKAEAEAECRRKVEAIETVWKLINGNTPANGHVPASSQNGSKPADPDVFRGSLQEAVRRAYQSLSGEFTHKEIYKQITVDDPVFAEKIKDKLPSLSNTLKRLSDVKELVLVEVGRGKRPSRFRRPG